MNKINVVIASHKKVDYEAPFGYSLMQLNSNNQNEQWEGYLKDNTGDNISYKNYSYCELTALYWLWKNDDSDIKGLAHYRRLFSGDDRVLVYQEDLIKKDKLRSSILDAEKINEILKTYECIAILPYDPYPQTGREDLLNYVYEKDILTMDNVLAEMYPAYVKSYNDVMYNSYHLCAYNMLITNKTLFNGYCEWLFPLLEEIEKRTEIDDYDIQHKRVYGYLSEFLLTVYLKNNKTNVKYQRITKVYEYSGKKLYSYYRYCIVSFLNKIGLNFLVDFIYSIFKKENYKRYKELQRVVSVSKSAT